MMNNMTLCESNKLFYKKYLYKLTFSNQLNFIFRTELQKSKLSYARERLDEYTESYRLGDPLLRKVFRTEVRVPEGDYLDAKELYNKLKYEDDFRIRVDPTSTLTIFSNNEKFLKDIAKVLKTKDIKLYGPNPKYIKYLQNKTKVILVDTPPTLPFKVNFNNKRCNGADFGKWIRANKDKAKLGKIALESLENYGYLNGFYMYVRDEKVLNLVTLLVGASIRNIEKLVYKGNIDK